MIALESGLTLSNHNFSTVLSHKQPSRVILAIPHDGLISNDYSGMFCARKFGIKGRDAHVWPVANDIVHRSVELQTQIDAVRFLMARAYVDANRELPLDVNLDPDTLGQTALDDPLLAPVYHEYHGQLSRLVERSITRFGADQVLFIDLHGFGRQPRIAPPEGYDLILGTANRVTIHHGEVDRTFATYMRERGYSVFLPNVQPMTLEGDPFSAGHTTRWYAKHYRINAIQIEIFSSFRRRESEIRGRKLALDIADFLSHHYR